MLHIYIHIVSIPSNRVFVFVSIWFLHDPSFHTARSTKFIWMTGHCKSFNALHIIQLNGSAVFNEPYGHLVAAYTHILFCTFTVALFVSFKCVCVHVQTYTHIGYDEWILQSLQSKRVTRIGQWIKAQKMQMKEKYSYFYRWFIYIFHHVIFIKPKSFSVFRFLSRTFHVIIVLSCSKHMLRLSQLNNVSDSLWMCDWFFFLATLY